MQHHFFRSPEVTDPEFALFENLTRRHFLVGVGALGFGVLTGCGAPSASAPMATSGATRTIRTSMGDVTIPANPKRVVALNDTMVAYPLLDLGFRVIASTGPSLDVQVIRAGKYDVSDMTYLGRGDSPDLEKIAQLDAELIIGTKGLNEQQFAALTELAPTVLLDFEVGMSVFDYHRSVAEVVNAIPQYEALIQRIDERTATLKERLAALLPTLEVSAMSADSPTLPFIYYGAGTPWSVAFERLGIAFPTAFPPSAETLQTPLSLEALPRFDGDVLFMLDYPGTDTIFAELKQSPIFQSLNAVRKGQVFHVSYDDWQYARVPGIETVYDDIETFILGRQIDTSADFR
jgi:iron complex transport system substrate-binding protein